MGSPLCDRWADTGARVEVGRGALENPNRTGFRHARLGCPVRACAHNSRRAPGYPVLLPTGDLRTVLRRLQVSLRSRVSSIRIAEGVLARPGEQNVPAPAGPCGHPKGTRFIGLGVRSRFEGSGRALAVTLHHRKTITLVFKVGVDYHGVKRTRKRLRSAHIRPVYVSLKELAELSLVPGQA